VIATARYGAEVVMTGRLGDDPGGAKFRDALTAEGIDFILLTTSMVAATGLALIVLEPRGRTASLVSSGANGR
jgi:sugar/nucleoside kinase (ribokinase family)